MADPGSVDRLRATGERIDALLDATGSAGDPRGAVARERAEELVRLTADLYGAGLARLLDILYDAGRLDEEVLAALAADELVAGLLLVHGLHPYDVTQRVELALDGVRPYLGSHGGDVELLGVAEDGTVRLRLLGSCDGCPSSGVPLKRGGEGARGAAPPGVPPIGVGGAVAAPGGSRAAAVTPVAPLRARLARNADAPAVSWEPLPQLADL